MKTSNALKLTEKDFVVRNPSVKKPVKKGLAYRIRRKIFKSINKFFGIRSLTDLALFSLFAIVLAGTAYITFSNM